MSFAAHFGEHYNARGLAPEVIADSFVAPRQFWEVSSQGNSVLVGPRGSGKTTLLRMLDPRSLERWIATPEHEAPEGWAPPTYIGVFIPIDTAWVSSLANVSDESSSDEHDQLYLAIYSLAAARCLVEIMRWRVTEGKKRDAELLIVNTVKESELACHLGDIFLAGINIRSLLELRIELSKRIASLPGDWQMADASKRTRLVAGLQNPLASVAAACEVFNTLVDEPDRKWCLLCDELEIAPLPVRRLLFSGLRAVPSPLLLKMALTPKEQLGAGESAEPPLPANDYEVVPLSYPTREEGAPERERENFCLAMWRSLVSERGGDLAPKLDNPFKAFEDPIRMPRKDAISRSNELDRKFGRAFRSLAVKDASFAYYLAQKEVDIDDLDKNSQDKRDAVIRKVRPIVEIREHNLRLSVDGRLTKIPRRTMKLYCGARRVFAVSEGHPRWLKYTLGAMLTRAVPSVPNVRLTDQSRELRYAVQRIDARLRALPVECESAHDLVQAVGGYFSNQILGPEFRADPALSFIVDSAVSEGAQAAVAQALYLGALVPLQADVFHLFTRGLEGRRFRLSNWLAPDFSLPLMTGKAINLSTILSGRNEITTPPALHRQFPLELGNDLKH